MNPESSADRDRPIRIAEDVYWVGVYDPLSHIQFNTYLIVDEEEAVLIDGGGRSGFASVVIKILQSGIVPSSVKALVFQNYNPHYTGSVFHFQELIDREDLKIISDRTMHIFLRRDCSRTDGLLSLEDIHQELTFSSGRRLELIKIPFVHSAGSFATFDHKSKILFTGELFGCSTQQWKLFLKLKPACRSCSDFTPCPIGADYCPIRDILDFHRNIMASERSLRHALDRIANVPFTVIAPQHGSIIRNPLDIVHICRLLADLKNVGIDGIIGNKSFFDLGNISPIQERLISPP